MMRRSTFGKLTVQGQASSAPSLDVFRYRGERKGRNRQLQIRSWRMNQKMIKPKVRSTFGRGREALRAVVSDLLLIY
jgi:hypothetical protein